MSRKRLLYRALGVGNAALSSFEDPESRRWDPLLCSNGKDLSPRDPVVLRLTDATAPYETTMANFDNFRTLRVASETSRHTLAALGYAVLASPLLDSHGRDVQRFTDLIKNPGDCELAIVTKYNGTYTIITMKLTVWLSWRWTPWVDVSVFRREGLLTWSRD